MNYREIKLFYVDNVKINATGYGLVFRFLR
jgi:hypothetical protein